MESQVAQLTAAVGQLQEQLTQQHMAGQQLQAELLSGRQLLTATQQQLDEQRRLLEQAGHGRGPSLSPKLPKPACFTGQKREPTPQNWAHAMENYLTANRVKLDEASSVTLAAGYLADSALTWYRLHLSEVDRGVVQPYRDWHTFKTALLKKFVPIAPEVLARTKLYHIRQTQSVQTYATEYNMCMLEIPDMTEKDRVDRFCRGLKAEVRVLVELQKPSTLVEAIELATQIDSIMWQSRKTLPRSFAPTSSPYVKPSNGPTAMELGLAQSKFLGYSGRAPVSNVKPRKPVTPSGAPFGLRSARPDSGRPNVQCFYCKRMGHVQRDCYRRQRNMVSKDRGSQRSA
jgi:hypothetical protein